MLATAGYRWRMNPANAPGKLTDDVAQRVVDALARPRWSSPDATLWAMLSDNLAASNRLIVRWGMIVAVVSYVSYGLFDYFLFPDVAHQLILTRVILGLIFIIIMESAVRASASINTLHLIAAGAIVTGSIGWLAVAINTTYHEALSYFILFGIIFILGANLFFNFRFWMSATASTIISVTFIVATLFILQLEIYVRIVVSVLLANCLLSSLYLSWRLGIERYRTFLHALRAQIQEQAAVENGRKLVEMANTDPLTGLRNRRAIEREFIEMQMEWAASDDEIGLILIDVDHFKRYNDRFGHHAGDECLITLTQSLSETASLRGAVVGRYGGEEFIVLCKVKGREDLARFAQTFCSRIEDLGLVHPDRDDQLGIVTISAGATISQAEKISDLDALLQEADRALYVSKFAGRARSTVFEPGAVENDPSSDNLSRLLRSAIEKNLVSVV
jgi:diguanylate cyclase